MFPRGFPSTKAHLHITKTPYKASFMELISFQEAVSFQSYEIETGKCLTAENKEMF